MKRRMARESDVYTWKKKKNLSSFDDPDFRGRKRSCIKRPFWSRRKVGIASSEHRFRVGKMDYQWRLDIRIVHTLNTGSRKLHTETN